MKSTLIIFVFCGFCIILDAQSDKKSFEDKELGWSIRYSSSWTVVSKEEIERIESNGRVAMESAVKGELDFGHRSLIWLKKDAFNSFTSSSQPYDAKKEGPYSESIATLQNAITETYKSKGIKFDSQLGMEIVDGLKFTTIKTIIYTSDRKKIIMTQLMYDRLIRGKESLTININFNNKNDSLELLSIVRSSKFSIRN